MAMARDAGRRACKTVFERSAINAQRPGIDAGAYLACTVTEGYFSSKARWAGSFLRKTVATVSE